MSWRKWILVSTIVLVVATPFLWFKGPPAQVRQLPDGSILVLEKVSFGKKHFFVPDKTYRRFFSPFIHLWRDPPFKLFGFYLPFPSYGFVNTQSNSVAFFLLNRSATNRNTFGFWSTNFQAVVSTKEGFEVSLRDPGSSELGFGGYLLTNLTLHGETLDLRILQKTNVTNWLKVAEFEIKNPIPLSSQK